MKKFASFLFVILALAFVPTLAPAAMLLTITQSGNDVTLSAQGSLNITGLTTTSSFTSSAGVIVPASGIARPGSSSQVALAYYNTPFNGPSSFGTGSLRFPDSGTGNPFGPAMLGASGVLGVPMGYTSGALLSGSSLYTNSTLSSLGITPGTYIYTFNTGANADTYTITAAVPEPSTWALLGLGTAGAGWVTLRRRRALV